MPEQVTVRELVREVAAAVVPAELPLVDEAADAWEAGELHDGSPGQWHGGAIGGGELGDALVYLIFPIVSGAVVQVLGLTASERVQRWSRRRNPAPALPAEVLRHADAVRDACVKIAMERGVRRREAEAIGDAVYVAFIRAAGPPASGS